MESPWLSAPADIALLPGNVYIFRWSLEPDSARLDGLASLLSADEIERSERFLPDDSRRAFITARGEMRRVLAKLLGQEPASLHFAVGERGKPSLPGERLKFNLSHSGGLALLASTLDREVGVDIEWMQRRVDYSAVAPRFFAPAEAQALSALPESERRAAFFAIWTRKEAYMKARGMGFSIPLNSFTVSHGDPPTLSVPGYTIRDLRPAPTYAAALVVEGEIEGISQWDWDRAE